MEAPALEKVPAVHEEQVADPDELYEPARQFVQDDEAATLVVPAPQSEQLADET